MGPIANTPDDLVVGFKALTTEKSFTLDLYQAPLPFNQSAYETILNGKKLRIGYYEEFPTLGTS